MSKRNAMVAALLPLLLSQPVHAQVTMGSIDPIERLDPAIDALIPRDARLEQIAQGFVWSEGPVWRPQKRELLFSDVPMNTIYRWTESDGLSVFLRPSGLAAGEPAGREHGSNGLTIDNAGAVVMADHGNRGVARLSDSLFTKQVLADRYDGKRFNSPNDLVYAPNGDLYFTDPPYGLRGLNRSPVKELEHNGVYRIARDGTLSLVIADIPFPNGIAVSPDGRTLYVANSEGRRAILMAYAIAADGSVSNGRVFFDATALAQAGAQGVPDGMRVDRAGNIFATGPGGVLVLSPNGRHLGTIRTGQPTANCAFGDDGSTLYITANDRILRIRLTTKGLGF